MDMVERVARAICTADDWTVREFDNLTRDERARYAAMARAAIAAMAVPTDAMTAGADGYVMYCNENEVLAWGHVSVSDDRKTCRCPFRPCRA